MTDLIIVDSHAHIFPPLGEASGYADVETHRMYLQNGMVGRPQPYHRVGSGDIVDEPDMLWELIPVPRPLPCGENDQSHPLRDSDRDSCVGSSKSLILDASFSSVLRRGEP